MDTLPTFSGFPQAGPEFLANLAAHNNRVWFESQKNEYYALLLEPAQAFVRRWGRNCRHSRLVFAVIRARMERAC